MAWLTTEDGRRVNTEWFTEDERKKYQQIEENQKQAQDKQLDEHFAEENKRVAALMKKRSGSVEMKNGQILEKYTMDEMKRDILKDAKEAKVLYDDNFIAIQYTDGRVAIYSERDDTSKMQLSNIYGVIWDNGNTEAYAGHGVEIVNYRERYRDEYIKKGYEDDWRLEFEHYKKG